MRCTAERLLVHMRKNAASAIGATAQGGFVRSAVIVHLAAKVCIEPIVLKNSCLIEAAIADSIPLLIGGFDDDGTKAGGASGAVL